MKKLLVWIAFLALVAAAGADTLRLKNGETLEGTYLGGDSRTLKFIDAAGQTASIPLDEVRSIEFGDDQAPVAPVVPAAPLAPAAPSAPTLEARADAPAKLPAGTVITVRMIDSIDSEVTGIGDRYRAGVETDVSYGGEVVLPRGADALVEIIEVKQAGKLKGKTQIALRLVQLTVHAKERPVSSGEARLAGKSKGKGTLKKSAIFGGIGAAIGAIAGGGAGAAIGAAAGAGAGVIVSAAQGSKLTIPSETLLDFVLSEDVPR